MSKYKAKSLAGAQRRVRELQKQIESWSEICDRVIRERNLMAMLAAETPQFSNPLDVAEAKQIRDRVLKPLNDQAQARRTGGVDCK